jgi:hypothetical protein
MNPDMNHLDPAFDPRIADWLEADPDRAPHEVLDTVLAAMPAIPQRHVYRVPWRFPRMSVPVRTAVLIALGLLVIAGAMAIGGVGGRSAPIPSVRPSAATVPTAATTVTLPALDATFISPWHGYHIKYPSAWRVNPAINAWAPNTGTLWGDPALDEIKGSSLGSDHTDVRFVGTQQKYAPGQTEADWLQKYCAAASGVCAPSALPTTKVGGNAAYITLDGVPAAGGTIVPGGKIFDVVVPLSERAYDFTLDGDIDRATLDAFLATIRLIPSDAVDTPPLTERFTSPTNGFSVGMLPEWQDGITTATEHWHGLGNPSEVMDAITITGTDTNFGGASQPLGSQTFDDFLAAYHTDLKPHVPEGCDGGEPSTWPEIRIGDQVGRLDMLCNAADAFVEAGGRVYIFEWGSETFDSTRHFSLASWKALLSSVSLDPQDAKE